MTQTTVTYRGFLQTVRRTFESKEQAERWARQCGVFARVVFTTVMEEA